MERHAQRTLPLEGGGQGGGESVELVLADHASHAMLAPRSTFSPHPLTPAPSRGGGIGDVTP